jgi:hypothetical protein
MKKLLYLFLAITVGCSSGDDSSSNGVLSQLTIRNNTNSDFKINEISFVGYNFTDLNILNSQSQTFILEDGFVGGTSNININLRYTCGGMGWIMSDSVNFIEGDETSIEFVQCASGGSGYCREVCLEQS